MGDTHKVIFFVSSRTTKRERGVKHTFFYDLINIDQNLMKQKKNEYKKLHVKYRSTENGYGNGLLREAAKKVHPLVAGPLRGGKGRAINEKGTFFETFF